MNVVPFTALSKVSDAVGDAVNDAVNDTVNDPVADWVVRYCRLPHAGEHGP